MTNKTKTWLAIVATLALLAIVVAAGPAIAASLNLNTPAATPTAPADEGTTNNGSNGTSEPSATAPSDPTGGMAMKPVPAPIESVDIRVAESMPPQYFAEIKYGLPSGCAKPGEYTVTRDGNTIRIAVTILQPADDNVVCTMIYGIGEHNVPLGTDFESGETYYVDVNGEVTEFVAQ